MADSKNIDDGGPAFPGENFTENGFRNGVNMGMSLRDWFAGQALPQLIVINDRVTAGREKVPYELALKVTASQAYALADAMIDARKAGA